jgi:hypothetical protein
VGLQDPQHQWENGDVLRLGSTTVPVNQGGVTFDAVIPFPAAVSGKPGHPSWLIVEDIQVFCRATAATASVDARKGAASVLNAPVTPVAGNVVAGSLLAADAPRRFSPGDQLNVVATTNGTGTITDLAVYVRLRADYRTN